MNFLITKQTIDGVKINSVNARELWEQLEVKTRFNDWIRRKIDDSMFVEGQDFLVVTQNRVTEGTEYIISLEMAKHLAMMEKTGRAFEVRQYFIDAERQLRETPRVPVPTPTLPTTYLEALQDLIAKEQRLLAQAPVVEAYNDLTHQDEDTMNFMSLGEVAKELGYKPRKELSHTSLESPKTVKGAP